jgi:hypothetical protein
VLFGVLSTVESNRKMKMKFQKYVIGQYAKTKEDIANGFAEYFSSVFSKKGGKTRLPSITSNANRVITLQSITEVALCRSRSY